MKGGVAEVNPFFLFLFPQVFGRRADTYTMSQPVPASTKIRRSRVSNIDLDRLQRRRTFLIDSVTVGSRDFENRMDWVVRVAELAAIERELVKRGALDRGDGHLAPDVIG